MVSATCFVRTLVGMLTLAMAVIAHPLIGSSNNTDCCEHETPPWENAVCETFVSPSDGKCLTMWWNSGVLRRDASDVFLRSKPPTEAKIASSHTAPDSCNSDNIDTQVSEPVSPLSKRLSYERTNTMQRVCQDDSKKVDCMRRGRNANPDECRLLASWWEKKERFGRCVIENRDLAGWNWLPLIKHNSCIFAVGNTSENLPQSTLLGNGDLADALKDGVRSCGPMSKGIEAEGVLACKQFPLAFWVTNSDKCCRGRGE